MKNLMFCLFILSSTYSSISFGREPNGLFEMQQERKERRINYEGKKITDLTQTTQPQSEENQCCC